MPSLPSSHTHTRAFMHKNTHTCTYTHTYIHTRAHAHAHTHTDIPHTRRARKQTHTHLLTQGTCYATNKIVTKTKSYPLLTSVKWGHVFVPVVQPNELGGMAVPRLDWSSFHLTQPLLVPVSIYCPVWYVQSLIVCAAPDCVCSP
jgi:hypothetical protein